MVDFRDEPAALIGARRKKGLSPYMALNFGVKLGHPLYAEFQITWTEWRNSEGVQIGVSTAPGFPSWPSAPTELLFCFCATTGAVFQYVGGDGEVHVLRKQVLPLLMDLEEGQTGKIMVGLAVGPGGEISLFRKGLAGVRSRLQASPVLFHAAELAAQQRQARTPGRNDDVFLAAGRTGGEKGNLPAEQPPQELYILIRRIDSMTRTQVEVTRVGRTPPASWEKARARARALSQSSRPKPWVQ